MSAYGRCRVSAWRHLGALYNIGNSAATRGGRRRRLSLWRHQPGVKMTCLKSGISGVEAEEIIMAYQPLASALAASVNESGVAAGRWRAAG